MATEPFLINPKRLKRRRSNPGAAWHSKAARSLNKKREAWGGDISTHTHGYYSGAIDAHSRSAEASRRGVNPHRYRRNPLGEEVLILGLNPRRRKKSKTTKEVSGMARRRKRARKANPRRRHARSLRMSNPRRRTRRRLRMDNPRRRRSRKRALRLDNPRRRSRSLRRRHNNPRRKRSVLALRGGLTGGLMSSTMKALPHVGVGAASVIVTALIPRYIPIQNKWAKLGGQLVVVFGGGYAVNKLTKGKYGLAWIVGGGSVILADLLRTYLLGGLMSGLGFDGYDPGSVGAYERRYFGDMGAATPYSKQSEYMGAFEDTEAFGGFGDTDYAYQDAQ